MQYIYIYNDKSIDEKERVRERGKQWEANREREKGRKKIETIVDEIK